MSIAKLLKVNPTGLLLSKPGKNFDGKLRCIKSPDFRPSLKFAGVKVKSFINDHSAPTPIIRKENVEGATTKQNRNFGSRLGILLMSLKRMRIPAAVVMFMLSFMLMTRRKPAFDVSTGMADRHRSFSPSSTSTVISSNPVSVSNPDADGPFLFFCLAFPFILGGLWTLYTHILIIKLQVGLLVRGRSLQNDLTLISQTYDTFTSDGLRARLEKTIDSLLRHDEYWISGYSCLEEEGRPKYARKYFKKLLKKERRRFDIETVDSNALEIERMDSQEANGFRNSTLMVVTILVSCWGLITGPDMPTTILDYAQLKKALKELQFVSKHGFIKEVKVLWTPQKESDILSLDNYQKIIQL